MTDKNIAALKAEIIDKERLYLTELKTTQKFENLKAIRLKINMLKQQLLPNQQNEPLT